MLYHLDYQVDLDWVKQEQNVTHYEVVYQHDVIKIIFTLCNFLYLFNIL